MKRSEMLNQFSREHHQALVHARRIALATEADFDILRQRLLEDFVPALLDHFLKEETHLLPTTQLALTDDAARLLDEHARLRNLIDSLRHGELAALKPFGVLLADHVRFEERQLFPALDPLLSTDQSPGG